MSVPRVTSPGICNHGLGGQLKTTHTIGSSAHLEKYLCNQLRVLGGGFNLSKAAPKHLDATHLSGTQSRDCPRVSAHVPQDGSIHISLQSIVPMCLCAQRAALAPHPQALTVLGTHSLPGSQTPLQALTEEIIQKQPQPRNISMQECYYLHRYPLLIWCHVIHVIYSVLSIDLCKKIQRLINF